MSMSRFDWDQTEKRFATCMEQLQNLIEECASFSRALEDKGEFLEKRHDKLKECRRKFQTMTRDCEKMKQELKVVKTKVDSEVIPDTKIVPNGWWSQ